MLDKLQQLDNRYSVIQAKLSAPETYEDAAEVARLNRELAELEEVVMTFRARKQKAEDLETAELMLSDPDPEVREMAKEELTDGKEQLAELDKQLQILLLPIDPNDDKPVIVEIRAGVGGEEAALFAHSLYRMYTMYSDKRRWQTQVVSSNETELGGVKELIFTIESPGAYSR
ncbi:MAG: PCRF domain-containing protein, partial [Oscillospiraceae bacterium]|nr:PCRF domain-containing protein [Oscillospiraceae bacterium]